MEVLFRRAAIACWSAILVLVVVLTLYPSRPTPPRLHFVDSGSDVALEQSAAIVVAASAAPGSPPPPPPPPGPLPPGRLVIPSIGVNARVTSVAVDKDGAMAVPTTSFDVGWYSPGVVPGEPGDAVIDGHLDWYDTSQAVFYNLKAVRVGDSLEVQRLDGVTRHFKVTRVSTVAYNASVPGLFDSKGTARLSLITCGGTWDKKLGQYLQRVIVDAELEG